MEILARAVGRRKEAVAQVQLVRGTGQFIINEKPAEIYLQNNTFSLLKIKSPFEAVSSDIAAEKTNMLEKAAPEQESQHSSASNLLTEIDTIVKVKGGGLIGQAEAIKLAVARALCLIDQSSNNIRKVFKLKGYLTQDSRVKERRKYGLKKARKAPQYSKR
uniref:Small ribosomal subunit protein uS9c n=1 Tax=Carteria sp. SAG 8-5 TaxID=1756294 RepID=A0A0S2LPT4_9CHLO|nr:ribosomal protein S9 [Carteria sp. SAG 8-5]